MIDLTKGFHGASFCRTMGQQLRRRVKLKAKKRQAKRKKIEAKKQTAAK